MPNQAVHRISQPELRVGSDLGPANPRRNVGDHQRRTVLCWLVSIPVVFANWCGMAAFAQTEILTPEFGLRFLQDQPEHRFQSATLDRIPVDLSQSLRNKSLTLFRPECLPFAYRPGKVELVPKARPTDAKIRVFAASGPKERDLLEMKWAHRGVPLRWIMSANVSDIQVPLQPFREDTASEVSGQKVAEFVSEVLRFKGDIPGLDRDFKVDLPWPKTLDNGISFSSNSKVNITDVIWWFDRWDVVIKDNTVHILIYSRNPQIAGFDDGSQFFPAEFRRRLVR